MSRRRAKPSARAPLDPQEMLVFAALARLGGVRRAADELGIPRSTVSRRLAHLEAAVGAPLVVRTARRFALTEMGTAFAARCEQLEGLLRDAEGVAHRASSEPSGTLRLAVAPVLGEEILPVILSELVRRYPRLSFDVRLSVDYVNLRSGNVDVALRAWPLDDASDLFAARLGTSVSGFYLSRSYAEARGIPATPADLAQHECILVGGAAQPSWRFRVGSREQRVPVSGRVRVDSFRVARDLAARGGGVVSVAAIFAEPLVAAGDLVPILERYWPRTPIYAVHAGANPPPPKVRVFVDLAREAVAGALPAESERRERRKPSRWRSA